MRRGAASPGRRAAPRPRRRRSRGADDLAVAEISGYPPRDLVGHAEVAMAARLGDERAGRVDPRPGDGTLVDRLLDAEGGAAEVAYRREPAHERVTGADHGLGEHIAHLAHAGDHGRDRGERG